MASSFTRNASNGRMAKFQQYGWKSQGDEGTPMKLNKRLLRVDKSYQRLEVSKAKVATILRDFSWPGFGMVLVALRSDGRYYVFDGQHRVLACLERDDIEEVPCLVFEFSSLSDEARAFIDANTVRGPVSALSRFRSRLVAEDSDAMMISAIATEAGYKILEKRGAAAKSDEIACIEAIEVVYNRGADHLRRVLAVCKDCFGEKAPVYKIVRALSYLDMHIKKHHNQDITRRDVLEKLSLLGPASCERAFAAMVEMSGKSGEKVWAAALVQAINKGKRSRKIRPVFGD